MRRLRRQASKHHHHHHHALDGRRCSKGGKRFPEQAEYAVELGRTEDEIREEMGMPELNVIQSYYWSDEMYEAKIYHGVPILTGELGLWNPAIDRKQVKRQIVSFCSGDIEKDDMRQEVGVAWQIVGIRIQIILCDGSLSNLTREELDEGCDWLSDYFSEMLQQLRRDPKLNAWDEQVIHAYLWGEEEQLPEVNPRLTMLAVH
jgi:hypothetical protein